MEKWEREHIRDLAQRKLDLAGTPHKTGISANRGAPFNHTGRDRKHMAAITGSGKTVRGYAAVPAPQQFGTI
jgi:hypothetical protein